jgi:broad specificity phosphatase PhoE
MELYIIRHGQSTNNVTMSENPLNREVDPPLTELGQQQAQAVADYLANGVNADDMIELTPEKRQLRTGFGITKLYCSPMRRTLQTARPIGAALGLAPEIWVDIHEHGGMYLETADGQIVGHTGMTQAEILAEFPDYLMTEAITEQGWWNPRHGAEDIAGGMARAIRVAHALRKMAGNPERIALVTHGTFSDCLIKALLNQLPSPQIFYPHLNTAVTRFDLHDNRLIVMRYFNRVDHLTPELISG